MKPLIAVIVLAACGMWAQETKPKSPKNEGIITAERIADACHKVRSRYRSCYPTIAIPKPKPCTTEMALMQNMLPVMEAFAELMKVAKNDWNKFNTEPARDFVETVEAWR